MGELRPMVQLSEELRARKLRGRLYAWTAVGLTMAVVGLLGGPRFVDVAPLLSIALFFVFVTGFVLFLAASSGALILHVRTSRKVLLMSSMIRPLRAVTPVGSIALPTWKTRRGGALVELGVGLFLVPSMLGFAIYFARTPATYTLTVYSAIAALLGVLLLADDAWTGRQFAPALAGFGPEELVIVERRVLGEGSRRQTSEWDRVSLSPLGPDGWSTLTVATAVFDEGHPYRRARNHRFNEIRIPGPVIEQIELRVGPRPQRPVQ